ncbi:unnamed protein product [Fusarium venenatum]|uniref:Uncharacterized protein n=1 Tax=Fusarium venenatum TaxID=56646 RepID=A0A2L2TPN3_9HYPO|nr:LOW QUALITY PROTEIN: uncharacterized protein FVRRES_01918 [Fusarium venenatum]CEI65406.1 unnamed protein product [Fusarium venenatum]
MLNQPDPELPAFFAILRKEIHDFAQRFWETGNEGYLEKMNETLGEGCDRLHGKDAYLAFNRGNYFDDDDIFDVVEEFEVGACHKMYIRPKLTTSQATGRELNPDLIRPIHDILLKELPGGDGMLLGERLPHSALGFFLDYCDKESI